MFVLRGGAVSSQLRVAVSWEGFKKKISMVVELIDKLLSKFWLSYQN